MSWETLLLRVLSERKNYSELSKAITTDSVSEDTYKLVGLFGVYFDNNPLVSVMEGQSFVDWIGFRLSKSDKYSPDELQVLQLLAINAFNTEVTDESLLAVRSQLGEIGNALEQSALITRFNNGDLDGSLREAQQEIIDKYDRFDSNNHLNPIRKDLGTIIKEQDDETGLTFPLKGLNRTVAPLKLGDFVVIGAQNNTGKTALAVQMAVHFAKQLPPDSKILYLNNEGIGDHIILRTRQIALQLGKYELEASFKTGAPVEEGYKAVINGDSFKIEVIDIHGITVGAVQNLLRKHKPTVVIYDMIDAINGFGGGGMDVDRYKQLYSWARAQCANPDHHHIGVALTQVSHDGHGCLYVPKHALEGSKVAKQAQSDVLIMVGMEEARPTQRGIWTPRCKRTRKGATEDKSKFMAMYDSDVGMYRDAGESYEQKKT